MNDLDILKNALLHLKIALLDSYSMESIASINLELKIKKAIEEGERLIEDGEI